MICGDNMIRTCIICGKKFEGKTNNAKLCSDECKRERHKRREKKRYALSVKKIKKYYAICGKRLSVKYKSKYCSLECLHKKAVLRYRRRRAEAINKPSEIKCIVCGRAFKPERNRKCCSDECSKIRKEQIKMKGVKTQQLRRAKIRKVNKEIKIYSPITTVETPKMIRKTCVNCGRLFETFDKNKVCCSDDCKPKGTFQFKQKHLKIHTKRCKICGKEFTTTNKSKKYCSLECINKSMPPLVKPNNVALDEIIKQAAECGMSYGKYRSMISMGKTYEELKQV